MTNFELLKCLSLEGLAGWLDSLEYSEDSPWNQWFDNEYCNDCKFVECSYADYWGNDKETLRNGTVKCAYCELYNKCKHFPDLEAAPTQEEVIIMWLRRDIDD